MEYDNTNRGVLFRNDRRETEKHPEYTGTINVDGTDYRLAAWVREGKGRKYFSLAISPKEPKSEPKVRESEDFNDDIPF